MLFSHPLPDGAGNAIAQNGTIPECVDPCQQQAAEQNGQDGLGPVYTFG